MTKTYIKPETITIKVESQQIMAGSGGVKGGDSPTDAYNSEDETYSRGFNFFEEENEEEY